MMISRERVRLVEMEYKNVSKGSSEFEVERKISELRLKLNKAIESNIDKSEIVNISQELDKYIVGDRGRFRCHLPNQN